jgi:tetratricopeptide (TPR) repeat protein
MAPNQQFTTESIRQQNLKVAELQTRGESPQALSVALETEQLARTHLPDNDPERAKAIYNLGAIQTAAGDRNGFETLDRALTAMSAAFGEQHPFYGRLLALIADRHGMFGEYSKAEAFFVKAIATLSQAGPDSAGHFNDAVYSLTQLHRAVAQQEELVAAAEPLTQTPIGEAHFERSLQTQSMRKELDLLPPEIREFAEKNLDSAQKLIGTWSTHQVAQSIIKDRETRGEPFALLLRGFEGEAYDYVVAIGPKLSGWPGLGELLQFQKDPTSITNDPSRKMVVTFTGGPSKVETILAEALSGHLRAVTVASPSSIDSGQTTQGALFPRIVLSDESWLSTVRSYIRAAHVIVMDGLGLNPGVQKELEAIIECGKCANAVILLHKDRSEFDKIEDTAKVMADIAGGTLERRTEPEWLTADQPLLASFPNIGYVDDLLSDKLAESPLFSLLFQTIPLVRSMTRLIISGMKLINSGNPGDGSLYLQIALLIGRGVPGWSERAITYFNLGILYRGAGDPATALQIFAQCHQEALTTNDSSDQGRALSMMGDCYLKLGQSLEAKDTLLKSLKPLDAEKDVAYLKRSLRALSEACKLLGEETQSASILEEVQHLESSGGWSLSNAGSSFRDVFNKWDEASRH